MFTDTDALLITWLSEQLRTARVVAALPSDLDSAAPVVQLTRVGGAGRSYPWSPDGPLHDQPSVDVDIFATRRAAATDLALATAALMHALRNTTLTAPGIPAAVVADVRESIAFSWRPDWNSRVSRQGATFELTMRPA